MHTHIQKQEKRLSIIKPQFKHVFVVWPYPECVCVCVCVCVEQLPYFRARATCGWHERIHLPSTHRSSFCSHTHKHTLTHTHTHTHTHALLIILCTHTHTRIISHSLSHHYM